MTPKSKQRNTRQRLIEAAGRLFADKGFQGASLREICGRAKSNLSAVAYHFGGKEGLYRTVCAYVLERVKKQIPLDGGLAAEANPVDRLRAFVQGYMARTCDVERPPWEQQLIHREMMNPSPIGRKMIASALRNEVEMLKGIVRELAQGKSPDDPVELCVLSIMGQCHFHAHYRRHKTGGLEWPHLLSKTTEEVADHISRFSLAGIRSAGR